MTQMNPPTRQPYARDIHDHADQGCQREEDDAEQRQDERVECCVDEGRPGDPEYQQREPREKSTKQREQTTHPHYLLSGFALSDTRRLTGASPSSIGFTIQGRRPQAADQAVLANGGVAIHRNSPSVRVLICSRSASRLSSISPSTVVGHPPGTHFP